jgi:hypothetical protein
MSAMTAQADREYIAICSIGQICDIHTYNQSLNYGNKQYRHVVTFRPMVQDLGIRVWCNGKELPSCFSDNETTVYRYDNEAIAEWSFDFEIGEIPHIRYYLQEQKNEGMSARPSNNGWSVTVPGQAWLPASSFTKEAAAMYIALSAQHKKDINIFSVIHWIDQFFNMVNIPSTGDNIIILNPAGEEMRKRILPPWQQ